ncbi:MAG: hypothetical protein K5681_10525 [Treponema sp.]|nr:hypothetical protein [Treponema sp.]
MVDRENPVYGRKIFFINPSLFVENFIVESLLENEYEVYVINEIRAAKPLLASFPDSMCFVDIDTEMPFSNWFNFINSFASEENLKSVYIGVVSETAKAVDMDKFLMNLKLPGGFIMIEKRSEALIQKFIDILDLNGAKGRRKYMRLDTSNLDTVNGYLTVQDRIFTFDVNEISVAGFVCVYRKEFAPHFQKNTHVHNVCLTIRRKSMVFSCIVYNTVISNDGQAISILMFTNENTASLKREIRKFIIENYEEKLEYMKKNLTYDYNTYNEPQVYATLKADSKMVAAAEAADAEDVLEVSDAAEADTAPDTPSAAPEGTPAESESESDNAGGPDTASSENSEDNNQN